MIAKIFFQLFDPQSGEHQDFESRFKELDNADFKQTLFESTLFIHKQFICMSNNNFFNHAILLANFSALVVFRHAN